MKKFAIIAACAALAACGSNEAEEPIEPVDTAETTLDSTATGDMTGTYEVQLADGSVTREHRDQRPVGHRQSGEPAEHGVGLGAGAALGARLVDQLLQFRDERLQHSFQEFVAGAEVVVDR